MNNENNSALEQLAESKQEAVNESNRELDFEALTKKLQERHDTEKGSAEEKKVKYTVYIDESIAAAFNALCLKRGDQRKFINEAMKDFICKKAKELGI